jgi:peptide-methionine (S)-S-oxide reductase
MVASLRRTVLPSLLTSCLLQACTTDASARPLRDTLPVAAIDAPRTSNPARDTLFLAGGCFWGVEAVFEHVKGVLDVVSGYSGGRTRNPSYEMVVIGVTGHAESVRVVYDPSQVSYGELLRVFFSVVHDPTQLNRQGPDVGTQYRSAIFYRTPEQKRIAESYVAQLTDAKVFDSPIVTQLVKFDRFYDAEEYHQDFAAKNPEHPYIVHHDLPKVARLKSEFATLYRAR